jgi:hypothetical protein
LRWATEIARKDRPCAISFDAFDQLLVFLGRPPALHDVVGHLGKPPLSTILVGSAIPCGLHRGVWVIGVSTVVPGVAYLSSTVRRSTNAVGDYGHWQFS